MVKEFILKEVFSFFRRQKEKQVRDKRRKTLFIIEESKFRIAKGAVVGFSLAGCEEMCVCTRHVGSKQSASVLRF